MTDLTRARDTAPLLQLARKITNTVIAAKTAAQADQEVLELLAQGEATRDPGPHTFTPSPSDLNICGTCGGYPNDASHAAAGDPGLRVPLEQLRDKWREKANEKRGTYHMHSERTIATLRSCADELDALLARVTPRTSTEKCDHKFVDSTRCLKCGWTPDPPRVSTPPDPEE